MTFYPYIPVHKLRMARRWPAAVIFSSIVIIITVVLCVTLIKPKEKGIYDPILSPNRTIQTYEWVIDELYRRNQRLEAQLNDTSLYYEKRPETQHINCGRVLQGDTAYIQSIAGEKRVTLVENPELDMNCSAIRTRINRYPQEWKTMKNGMAMARIVYADYEFIEKQVQMSFHPQNSFCFVVDMNSSFEFQRRMRQLGTCFENVFVLPVTERYDSSGHNTNYGQLRCMEFLVARPGWNYLMLLQNNDVIIKSVYELEQIYELLGGANDVDIQPEMGRLVKTFKWDPRSLKLFRNESGIPSKILDNPMKMAKGDTEGSLSRAAVEWMVKTVDLSIFINQWNQSGYGCDEQFISSFQVNAAYGMPGHFTDECLRQGQRTEHVSRFTKWAPYDYRICASKTRRHSVCLMGIEDVRTMAAFPNLMTNKMIPHFDYSIIDCTAELLHNRTFLGQVDQRIQTEYYENMVNVLYHKNHMDPDYKLNCTPSYTTWKELPYPL